MCAHVLCVRFFCFRGVGDMTRQLMADPEGRYFGLWQAQRAWAAEEESTARKGDGGGTSGDDGLTGKITGGSGSK